MATRISASRTISFFTSSPTLVIKELLIKNFRSLEDIHIADLDPHMNLFIGENGSGKSSILDALSLILSWFVARFLSPNGKGSDISKDDISKHSKNGCLIQITYNISKKLDDEFNLSQKQSKLFKSTQLKKIDQTNLTDLTFLINNYKYLLEKNPDTPLPVIAHYGVNRLVPNQYPKKTNKSNSLDRLSIYKNALHVSLLFNDFFNWFRQSEDLENEHRIDDPSYRLQSLETVRKALEIALPGYSNLRIKRNPLSMTMKKGNKEMKINQLSDGEKCYITLIGDIARRLSLANPGGNPLEGDGIILIDEIDLHLHPQWQRDIVSKIGKIFPNIQFFITSHSPIVTSDVDGKVFQINDGEVFSQKTYGKTSDYILSNNFGIENTRSPRIAALISNIFSAISNMDNDTYQKELQKIISTIGADDEIIPKIREEKIRFDKQFAQ